MDKKFSQKSASLHPVRPVAMSQTAQRALRDGGSQFRQARDGLRQIRASKASVEEDLASAREAVEALERQQREATHAEGVKEAEVRAARKLR